MTQGQPQNPEEATALPDAALDGSGVDQAEVNELAAVTRVQSIAKTPSGAAEPHPVPARPGSHELARMLAAAGVTAELRRVVEQEIDRAKGEGEVAGIRAMFWSTDPLRLPRTSIIGRVLDHLRMYETGGSGDLKKSPAQIYDVLNDGPTAKGGDKKHHRSEAGKKHAEGKDSAKAATYFGRDLDRRWERLEAQGWVKEEGKKRWLTHTGQKIFRGWPAWATKDDDREALPEPDKPHTPEP